MWEKIPNPSHIGPTGFEARDSHDVARRINECNRELAHFAPALPSEKT
jgi:hypothetical protein